MQENSRPLPRWCKDVKIQMIEKDMKVNDLADAAGLSRVYVSEIICGRRIAPEAAGKISEILGVDTPYVIP